MTNYKIEEYHKGQHIFKEGHEPDNAFLVKTGSVEIYKIIDNERVVLIELGQGEIFGEMAIINKEPRTASALATGYCELVVVDRECLEGYLAKSPPFVQALTRSLESRLNNITLHIHGSVGVHNAFLCVCNVLYMMYMTQFEKHKNDDKIWISCAEAYQKIKRFIPIQQSEIEKVLNRLYKLKLIEFQFLDSHAKETFKDGRKREFVSIPFPKDFVKNAKIYYKEFKHTHPSHKHTPEFVDIHDFAKTVNSTQKAIYKKISREEIPENIFYFYKTVASYWVHEVGMDYFQDEK